MSGSVPGLCPLAADTALCSDSHACLRTLPGVPVGPRHARRGLVRELAAIGCLPLQLSTSPIESILFLTPNLFLPVVNGSVTHPTDCSHGKTWEPPWTAPPPSPASGQSALRLLNSTSLDLDPVPVTHSPPHPPGPSGYLPSGLLQWVLCRGCSSHPLQDVIQTTAGPRKLQAAVGGILTMSPQGP